MGAFPPVTEISFVLCEIAMKDGILSLPVLSAKETLSLADASGNLCATFVRSGDSYTLTAESDAVREIDLSNLGTAKLTVNGAKLGASTKYTTKGGSFTTGDKDFTVTQNGEETILSGADSVTLLQAGDYKFATETGATMEAQGTYIINGNSYTFARNAGILVNSTAIKLTVGSATLAKGKAITVGTTAYTAAADNTTLDYNGGKAKLTAGMVALDKGETVAVGTTEYTSAAKDTTLSYNGGKAKLTAGTVTLDKGGAVAIGTTEYTAAANATVLDYNDGKAKLTAGAVTLDKGEAVAVGSLGTVTATAGNISVGSTGEVTGLEAGESFSVTKDGTAESTCTMNADGKILVLRDFAGNTKNYLVDGTEPADIIVSDKGISLETAYVPCTVKEAAENGILTIHRKIKS